jgi:hypothetical protein
MVRPNGVCFGPFAYVVLDGATSILRMPPLPDFVTIVKCLIGAGPAAPVLM